MILRNNSVFVLALMVMSLSVQAGGFTVVSTQTSLVDGAYHLSAHLGFELSTEVNEAIQNGIPVTLVFDVEVLHPREYLWAKTVLKIRQQYKLQYHALSEQYLVKDLTTSEVTFYKVLDDALYNLENVKGLVIIKEQQLKYGFAYVARMRVGVNLKDLPAPLRFFAYFSSGWNLDSGWFSWPLAKKGTNKGTNKVSGLTFMNRQGTV